MEGKWIWGREELGEGETGRRGDRGNFGQNAIYERIIIKKSEEKRC